MSPIKGRKTPVTAFRRQVGSDFLVSPGRGTALALGAGGRWPSREGISDGQAEQQNWQPAAPHASHRLSTLRPARRPIAVPLSDVPACSGHLHAAPAPAGGSYRQEHSVGWRVGGGAPAGGDRHPVGHWTRLYAGSWAVTAALGRAVTTRHRRWARLRHVPCCDWAPSAPRAPTWTPAPTLSA